MTRLLLVRHGNTFDPGDTLLRVGLRTDLPLSRSGVKQAEALGAFLSQKNLNVDSVFCSTLQRTQQTASIILNTMGSSLIPQPKEQFNEIDYGIDDGKPETEVEKRLGKEQLVAWEQEGRVPPGWHVDPKAIIENWKTFIKEHLGKTILVVTSNGIARFATHLTGETPQKMATGSISCLVQRNDTWAIDYWGKRP